MLSKWGPVIDLDLVSLASFQDLVLDRESSLQQMWQPHPKDIMPSCEKFPETLGGRHWRKWGSFLGRRAGCSELWTLAANELSWSALEWWDPRLVGSKIFLAAVTQSQGQTGHGFSSVFTYTAGLSSDLAVLQNPAF